MGSVLSSEDMGDSEDMVSYMDRVDCVLTVSPLWVALHGVVKGRFLPFDVPQKVSKGIIAVCRQQELWQQEVCNRMCQVHKQRSAPLHNLECPCVCRY